MDGAVFVQALAGGAEAGRTAYFQVEVDAFQELPTTADWFTTGKNRQYKARRRVRKFLAAVTPEPAGIMGKSPYRSQKLPWPVKFREIKGKPNHLLTTFGCDVDRKSLLAADFVEQISKGCQQYIIYFQVMAAGQAGYPPEKTGFDGKFEHFPGTGLRREELRRQSKEIDAGTRT